MIIEISTKWILFYNGSQYPTKITVLKNVAFREGLKKKQFVSRNKFFFVCKITQTYLLCRIRSTLSDLQDWQSWGNATACELHDKTLSGWPRPGRTSWSAHASHPWSCSSTNPVRESWKIRGICLKGASGLFRSGWAGNPWGCFPCRCCSCPTRSRWGSTCRRSESTSREWMN